jgi:hypothetical protein
MTVVNKLKVNQESKRISRVESRIDFNCLQYLRMNQSSAAYQDVSMCRYVLSSDSLLASLVSLSLVRSYWRDNMLTSVLCTFSLSLSLSHSLTHYPCSLNENINENDENSVLQLHSLVIERTNTLAMSLNFYRSEIKIQSNSRQTSVLEHYTCICMHIYIYIHRCVLSRGLCQLFIVERDLVR